jgi:hypothetical protein
MVGWDFSSVPPRKASWISFDSYENLQKGQRSAQNFVPPLEVGRGRVGIPGDFSVLEVCVAEITEE